MGKLIALLVLITVLTGCSSLEPVGYETAKWHGEHALRSLQNPQGVRF